MSDAFGRIRWRLTGWSVLVVGAIVLSLGATIYLSLARSLDGEVDRGLQANSQAASTSAHEFFESGRIDSAGYRGGLFFVILDERGNVLANPQGIGLEDLPRNVLIDPTPRFQTLDLGGDPVRVYTRQIDGAPAPHGVLVVGQSLHEERETMSRLLMLLVVGGGVGIILAVLGAWFLAGRALVPIAAALQRQQEFVADASHELRTPLTILHSATDLLDQHIDEPLSKNRFLLQQIKTEVLGMEHLTRDLLSLARSDRGVLNLALGRVDLGVLAEDLAERVRVMAEARGVQVEVSSDGNALIVDGDPDRLEQVGLILLDNAIKHTLSGGYVQIHARSVGTDGLLEVIDTGEGIPHEHLKHVFDRFYRIDRARTRATGGVGLGLSIAQSLVAAHGGTISIASQPGSGTRATIRLPVAPREDEDNARQSTKMNDLRSAAAQLEQQVRSGRPEASSSRSGTGEDAKGGSRGRW